MTGRVSISIARPFDILTYSFVWCVARIGTSGALRMPRKSCRSYWKLDILIRPQSLLSTRRSCLLFDSFQPLGAVCQRNGLLTAGRRYLEQAFLALALSDSYCYSITCRISFSKRPFCCPGLPHVNVRLSFIYEYMARTLRPIFPLVFKLTCIP
ncbi:hypothetical protein SISSUDRAFT_395668 [Sistotremastrum suecicum HHB10207 ss-3]|uniref:Uncharacterized protein n=1 Tax=Sistotremastrum suecicum HHB10207 ss-3 TaxID=1314776 RepID=A0A165YV53_9AGAM|nr:hypothetical protein SISSUDRAFT_395668 [Sistotremastrum suecicum HHB10207 ss-3]